MSATDSRVVSEQAGMPDVLDDGCKRVDEPCEHRGDWIIMPGAGVKCLVCRIWFTPEAFNKEQDMSESALTAEQVREHYRWKDAHIEILPYNLFVVKEKPEDAVGTMMIFPAMDPLSRISVEENTVYLENDLYQNKVEAQSELLNSGGFADPAKIHSIFPGKDIVFRSKEEWGVNATPAATVGCFRCDITGRLYNNPGALRKVQVLNPERPEEVKETLFVHQNELPRDS